MEGGSLRAVARAWTWGISARCLSKSYRSDSGSLKSSSIGTSAMSADRERGRRSGRRRRAQPLGEIFLAKVEELSFDPVREGS
jgi:hypothetical protein